ncbi:MULTISPECIES: thiosulfate oxidation carrier complex protein SoxZ [Rhizobium]|nr:MULTISPECIES: thiosulfate oxidation carrier complex protein SoxZ [Rhizobium]OWK22725.1 sulfur oxidation protein [Rhizobium yanglingense]QPB24095.1 thiosulfate oxidation carrier complex protein SoxZ [Rhizobium sp. 007]ULJ76631.1 thiosulfate oxidation carrier complex protein SoxZ [Rhizobium gallicum]
MVPGTAAKGEVIPVKTIVQHKMETGLRTDGEGEVIPRKIINKFICRYGGVVVFSVDLHEAVSANPFFEFSLLATESGRMEFIWKEDGGAVYSLNHDIVVT